MVPPPLHASFFRGEIEKSVGAKIYYYDHKDGEMWGAGEGGGWQCVRCLLLFGGRIYPCRAHGRSLSRHEGGVGNHVSVGKLSESISPTETWRRVWVRGEVGETGWYDTGRRRCVAIVLVACWSSQAEESVLLLLAVRAHWYPASVITPRAAPAGTPAH